MSEGIQTIGNLLWSYPLAILLLGTGIWLTITLRGVQFRHLGHALRLLFKKHNEKNEEGDISHFRALMTALAATVGTGNIVGVATAIAIGGPGALFWMWITGLLGMATKFAESLLGVKFRHKNKHNQMSGGPMYYLRHVLNWKFAAGFFAIMGVIAAITIGNMIQANSIADVVASNLNIPILVTAVTLMLAVGIIIIKGIEGIGRVTGTLVPIMIALYMVGGLTIIFMNITQVPAALWLIVKQAFTTTSAIGGFAGSAIIVTMRIGLARGLFSNEAGLGSGAVVAAAAKTKKPMTQALISMTQTFIDTLVVCTITGLVIILTGVWNKGLNGATLTSAGFGAGLPGIGNYVVLVTLVLFAFSTIIGWAYYGEKFLEYLFNEKIVRWFRYIYIGFVGLGAILSLELVWALGDIAVGLMAIPNLIAMLMLTKVIRKEAVSYEQDELE